MDELQIDWNQEKPEGSQLTELWKTIKFIPIETWTNATEVLKEKISESHSNGGIQLHKYKIIGNPHFDWFASRNRLDEINFIENVLQNKNLQNYRDNLKITKDKPVFKLIKYSTDIYDLPGELARMLGYGGAYHKVDPKTAWAVATEFVKEEFQYRFEEFNKFQIAIESANWFYDIAWDYSAILFDKRNYELIFLDVTDED